MSDNKEFVYPTNKNFQLTNKRGREREQYRENKTFELFLKLKTKTVTMSGVRARVIHTSMPTDSGTGNIANDNSSVIERLRR